MPFWARRQKALVGSLATGDFDLDSDVDFLILTNAELSDAEARSAQTTHVLLDCWLQAVQSGFSISPGLLVSLPAKRNSSMSGSSLTPPRPVSRNHPD